MNYIHNIKCAFAKLTANGVSDEELALFMKDSLNLLKSNPLIYLPFQSAMWVSGFYLLVLHLPFPGFLVVVLSSLWALYCIISFNDRKEKFRRRWILG